MDVKALPVVQLLLKTIIARWLVIGREWVPDATVEQHS